MRVRSMIVAAATRGIAMPDAKETRERNETERKSTEGTRY